jgi:N-ethylmaleimide reductase
MRSTIFDSIELGSLSLRNRIFMAPMTRSRATSFGVHHPLTPIYYAQRSDAGLIVSEATAISKRGSGYPNIPGIFTDEQEASWKDVIGAVHAKGGKIFIQLYHTGRVGHPSLTGGPLQSASPLSLTQKVMDARKVERPAEVPYELSQSEIAEIVRDFANAAMRAVRAGADGVEIHAANGYLIDQFIRDGVNKRTDEYGGNVENRLRFLLEIVSATSKALGSDRISVRLSPFNSFNEMSDTDPKGTFTAAAAALRSANLSFLHVIRAHSNDTSNAEFLKLMKSTFGGKIVANRGYDVASGNMALVAQEADAVAIGIPFLSNPDLVDRMRRNLPLNTADPSTFYSEGARGYTDYQSATLSDSQH